MSVSPPCPRFPSPPPPASRPRTSSRRSTTRTGPCFQAPGLYEEVDADGERRRATVTVTTDTRAIQGVTATVVHDLVTTEDGETIEDTYDWYAQDRAGNVWYLGEETAEYEDGRVVSAEGSWEAGRDGARAGIVMFAAPVLDAVYRQEYYRGHAEDAAKVLSLSERVTVPYGSFTDVLQTWDFTPLHLEAQEHKHYARGVGLVLVTTPAGEVRERLLSFTAP